LVLCHHDRQPASAADFKEARKRAQANKSQERDGEQAFTEPSGEEARNILNHRGQSPLSSLWPLAHLEVARALAMQGDTAQSRKSYQDFFTLWRDADQDIPILTEAKREFEKLK
jgi:hypothetical protein